MLIKQPLEKTQPDKNQPLDTQGTESQLIPRTWDKRIQGQAVSDGDSVSINRLIGTQKLMMLDPFLLLDEFSSDKPQDYIGGFPSHPHRGFETVTYMLAGKMRHKDNQGNEGVISRGGVQWMTAGRGIVHSEMPEQQAGLLQGFQLWVNLPAAEKMRPPAYQEFSASELAIERGEQGQVIKVIAGQTNKGTAGRVNNLWVKPTYLDIELPAGTSFIQDLPFDDNSFIYVVEGDIQLVGSDVSLKQKALGILTKGSQVQLQAGEQGAKCLLISGMPLKEPVERGGPFVMNTQAQLMQAFSDYRQGLF
ncbi:pirin family protein [Shewanella surugensis]|uniref:Pirin family protein n=1 Tax=Shewanella surugensis TaxID=212020 RepID=A0ABT0LBR9_9GAMM|nr:pirin family protein [Shewanella surugensis]MCL1125113.1 pirin family protein [Shewanella surugensis]